MRFIIIPKLSEALRHGKLEMTGVGGVGFGIETSLGAAPDTRKKKQQPAQKLPGGKRKRGCL
jgi:hypothetical protein